MDDLAPSDLKTILHSKRANFYAHSTERADRSDWQTLTNHLHAVAELAAQRAARFGWEDAGRTAGLLHDLGKYSEAFQRRLDGSGERVGQVFPCDEHFVERMQRRIDKDKELSEIPNEAAPPSGQATRRV